MLFLCETMEAATASVGIPKIVSLLFAMVVTCKFSVWLSLARPKAIPCIFAINRLPFVDLHCVHHEDGIQQL